jgi:hypothetical protein
MATPQHGATPSPIPSFNPSISAHPSASLKAISEAIRAWCSRSGWDALGAGEAFPPPRSLEPQTAMCAPAFPIADLLDEDLCYLWLMRAR